jgi:hypothetical protein
MLAAIAYGAILCGSVSGPAVAVNIVTSAIDCQTTDPTQLDLIVHDKNGVRTASFMPDPVWVVCAVPRSPITAGAAVGFYVDGDNSPGALTGCWISSYDWTGAFLGSTTFTTQAAQYDQLITPPISQLTTWAYTSLVCLLPRNGLGTLRGVTSMQ